MPKEKDALTGEDPTRMVVAEGGSAMVQVKKFVLEDVRCFQGRNEFDIRPMTFLIGENSTGKSTVLGCFQVLSRCFSGRHLLSSLSSLSSLSGLSELFSGTSMDFNLDPYKMGSFSDIARRPHSLDESLAESFSMGFCLDLEGKEATHLVTLKRKKDGSEPAVHQSEWRLPDGTNFMGTENATKQEPTVSSVEGQNRQKHLSFESPVLFGGPWDLFFCAALAKASPPKGTAPKWEEISGILNVPFPKSFAPFRAKPKRTYDPLKESDDSEGIGTPMMLRNMSIFYKDRWSQLRKDLVGFGKGSGLFDSIDVNLLKKPKESAPFELLIKDQGLKVNLIDVGYGVSQVLPILVAVFNENKPKAFLLQQPEVHLHPRAQAALTSLLAERTKDPGQRFLIETHSDAMINRIRIAIMNKKIKPEDVSLIYLEKQKGKAKGKVKVHNISFDDEANFEGAPRTFRQFFLDEADRLLGFKT